MSISYRGDNKQVFTMRDGQFVETLPPMKESRSSPSAVSSGSALVVAGRENTTGALSSVEVFKDGQWTTAPSLPSAGSVMQSDLHGDQWYLITYQGTVFCVSLLSLISGSDQSPWETLYLMLLMTVQLLLFWWPPIVYSWRRGF